MSGITREHFTCPTSGAAVFPPSSEERVDEQIRQIRAAILILAESAEPAVRERVQALIVGQPRR